MIKDKRLLEILESDDFIELCEISDKVEYYLNATQQYLIREYGDYVGRESWIQFNEDLSSETEEVLLNTLRHHSEVKRCDIQPSLQTDYLVIEYH